jgi:hypothetical protein
MNRGMRGENTMLSPSPSFVPAGVREHPAHPFDGADVQRTSATIPSHLPEGEGGEPMRAYARVSFTREAEL